MKSVHKRVAGYTGLVCLAAAQGFATSAAVAGSMTLTIAAEALLVVGVSLLALTILARDTDPRDLPSLKIPPGGRGPAAVSDVEPVALCTICGKTLRKVGESWAPCLHPDRDVELDDTSVGALRRLRQRLEQG